MHLHYLTLRGSALLVFELLEANNIPFVTIPSNCTDRLQPLDLSINEPEAITDIVHSYYVYRINTPTIEETIPVYHQF